MTDKPYGSHWIRICNPLTPCQSDSPAYILIIYWYFTTDALVWYCISHKNGHFTHLILVRYEYFTLFCYVRYEYFTLQFHVRYEYFTHFFHAFFQSLSISDLYSLHSYSMLDRGPILLYLSMSDMIMNIYHSYSLADFEIAFIIHVSYEYFTLISMPDMNIYYFLDVQLYFCTLYPCYTWISFTLIQIGIFYTFNPCEIWICYRTVAQDCYQLLAIIQCLSTELLV